MAGARATALEPAEAVPRVLARLRWMREQRIWPNGLRYLWTDAFGVVLYVSLYRELGDESWLDRAEELVLDVDRVLGRPVGLRIGEAPDRDGQYYHYLAKWMFALGRLGTVRPRHRERAIEIARAIHPRFLVPGVGVHWKMREDLRGPYPGYGLGALDAFDGWVVYRLLDDRALAREIADMEVIVERTWRYLHITQDLALGMMLSTTHFFPDEPWARAHRRRALETLDAMWVDPPGYFCREPGLRDVKFAFTNYGVSLGLQAVPARLDRVRRLDAFFESYRSGDEYDRDAITHVMACTSMLPGDFLAR
jgi:hypothetical protein